MLRGSISTSRNLLMASATRRSPASRRTVRPGRSPATSRHPNALSCDHGIPNPSRSPNDPRRDALDALANDPHVWRLREPAPTTLATSSSATPGGSAWSSVRKEDSQIEPHCHRYALELERLVDAKRCAFRSTRECGCSDAKCALKRGLTSYPECFECVALYGP